MTQLILKIETETELSHDDFDDLTNDLVATLNGLELDPVERVKAEPISNSKDVMMFIAGQLLIPIAVNIASDQLKPYLEPYIKKAWQWTQYESGRLGREVKVRCGEVAVSSTMTWLAVAQQLDALKLQRSK